MLSNLSRAYPALQDLILVTAYAMGFVMSGAGVWKMAMGTGRGSMMEPGSGYTGPLMMLMAGALLMAVPTTLDMMVQSIFERDRAAQVLSYVPSGGEPQKALVRFVLDTVILIGWVAAIRGIYLLSQAGDRRTADGAIWSGLLHLVAGAMAVNFTDVLMAVGNQLGVGATVSAILGT